KDHVGGAAALIREIEVGQILIPDYEGEGKEYREFQKAASEKKLYIKKLDENITFSLGNGLITVEPPDSYSIEETEKEYDNNFSLLTWVEYGDNHLFFAGDMEKERIWQWLSIRKNQTCDFLKVPHHGVYNEALGELLDSLKPSYAAICCSDKNPAEDKTLKLLQDNSITVYQTSGGTIRVVSNGKKLEISQGRER
ncbi:MAG: MBL fold metallo-hydrolase, partial [Lachnospiraceae bacterium]|nr:MBL fold metallo-hydrolase [Lachnospiraceae bacterium]